MGRIRLCVIVTVDLTLLNLCRGRFEYFQRQGFEITAVCAPTPRSEEIRARNVRLFTAPLTRAVTPLRDLCALWRLYRFLKKEQFDLIEVSTPKAALVGALAARLAGAPCIVQLLRGLGYRERSGTTVYLMRRAQRLASRWAHRVICISHATMEEAIREGLCPPDKITVFGHGSSNGIDLERFRPPSAQQGALVRQGLAIPRDASVAGFVGRLTKDKGVDELVEAFDILAKSFEGLWLLLVGDQEARDRPAPATLEAIRTHPRIVHVGWQDDTPTFLAAMDFFVLPTHREGFGTVLLEAAAMGLPVITTPAAGWWTALNKNEHALCIPAGDVDALGEAMSTLTTDPSRRLALGRAGRERVAACFDQQTVWSMQVNEFRRLLDERNSPAHSPRRRSTL